MYSSTTSVCSQVVKKRDYFKHFKPLNDGFSLVSICSFEETFILLESPFDAELNDLSEYIKVSISYDCLIKYA